MTNMELTLNGLEQAPAAARQPIGEVLEPARRLAKRVGYAVRSVVVWGDQQPTSAQYANGGSPF